MDIVAGERLPAIDTLAFSWCSNKVACVASGTPHIYIMAIETGHAHKFTMSHPVNKVVFDPSGERLAIALEASICIIDSMSGANIHEVQILNGSIAIEALSWPRQCNKDDSVNMDCDLVASKSS